METNYNKRNSFTQYVQFRIQYNKVNYITIIHLHDYIFKTDIASNIEYLHLSIIH